MPRSPAKDSMRSLAAEVSPSRRLMRADTRQSSASERSSHSPDTMSLDSRSGKSMSMNLCEDASLAASLLRPDLYR